MFAEFPLFIFTSFAGVAIGLYTAKAIFPTEEQDGSKRPSWLFPLICVALLGIGLIGCLGHLGRPWLFLNALSNPTAGITQEAYTSIAFMILLLVDLFLTMKQKECPRIIRYLGALAGVALAIAMGFAYANTIGVESWANWATVPFFVFGDLAMGFACYALLYDSVYKSKSFLVLNICINAIFCLSLIGLAAHVASIGLNVVPYVIALVLSPVVSMVFNVYVYKKTPSFAVNAGVVACVIIGALIARVFFYLI